MSVVPENVQCVYEIVMNGLSLDAIKAGYKAGIQAAADVHRCSTDYSRKLRRQVRPIQSLPERRDRRHIASFLSNFYLIPHDVKCGTKNITLFRGKIFEYSKKEFP